MSVCLSQRSLSGGPQDCSCGEEVTLGERLETGLDLTELSTRALVITVELLLTASSTCAVSSCGSKGLPRPCVPLLLCAHCVAPVLSAPMDHVFLSLHPTRDSLLSLGFVADPSEGLQILFGFCSGGQLPWLASDSSTVCLLCESSSRHL